MATGAANRATAEVEKAEPAHEKRKRLKLFDIVNQFMKMLRRVKTGRVTKSGHQIYKETQRQQENSAPRQEKCFALSAKI